MKKMRMMLVLAMCFAVILNLSACGNKMEKLLDPDDPVTITFWHSYNNLARSILESMTVEFNDTVGAQKGIIVQPYGFGEQDKLEEALYNSSNDVIGSEKMPDMFMSYMDNAYRIDGVKPLAELDEYFSAEERKEFRQEFLQEGVWSQGAPLKAIPIAKSTELLYLNKTGWDKFVESSSYEKSIEETFSTWENIALAAEAYYNQTGGKSLFGFNMNIDLMHVTAAQLGKAPYTETDDGVTFEYSKDFAKRIWEICYVPHINGWFQSTKYNHDSMRQGKLLSYIGSSAGSGFFPLEVTEESGAVYPVVCQVIEYPTFEGAEKYLTQRGANVCVTGAEQVNEYAAVEFIKWFTEAQNNTKFAVATGYIPVKEAALSNKEQIIANMTQSDNMSALQSSVDTTLRATADMKFVIKKPFNKSYEANSEFSSSIFTKIQEDLLVKEARINAGESAEAVITDLTGNENFEKWYEELITQVNRNME